MLTFDLPLSDLEPAGCRPADPADRPEWRRAHAETIVASMRACSTPDEAAAHAAPHGRCHRETDLTC